MGAGEGPRVDGFLVGVLVKGKEVGSTVVEGALVGRSLEDL
jgi:hypothetical protein